MWKSFLNPRDHTSAAGHSCLPSFRISQTPVPGGRRPHTEADRPREGQTQGQVWNTHRLPGGKEEDPAVSAVLWEGGHRGPDPTTATNLEI